MWALGQKRDCAPFTTWAREADTYAVSPGLLCFLGLANGRHFQETWEPGERKGGEFSPPTCCFGAASPAVPTTGPAD